MFIVISRLRPPPAASAHPNGMLATLQRVNPGNIGGPLYEQRLASDAMPRPGETVLSGLCTPPDGTITAPASLQAGAEGTATVAGDGTYVWTIQNGTITSSATAKTITFRAGCSGNVTLSVTVTSSCSATASRSVAVSAPTVAVSASPSRITAGASVTLTATTSASGPWSVIWSDGITSSGTGNSIVRTVTPNSTRTYSVTSVSGCTGSWGSATVTVDPPPAPTSLTATLNGNAIRLVWTIRPGADIDSYDVYRCDTACIGGGNFVHVGSSNTLSKDDLYPTVNKTYIYYVRAIKIGAQSAPSPKTFRNTVLYTDTVTSTSHTPLRYAHLVELRWAVDALRTAAGLPPASYTGGVDIVATQFMELRTALNAARTQLSFPPTVFTDEVLQPRVTPVKADHLNELRRGAGGVQ